MKIRITESELTNIIKECIRKSLKEDFDLFGNEYDAQAEMQKEKKKNANKARAQKSAETRKNNKVKKNNEINRLHSIARSEGDLFGNKYSTQQQNDALNKINTLTKKGPVK